MPTTVREKFGRRLSDTRAERMYTVEGTSSDTEARSAAAAEAPGSILVGGNKLTREGIEVEEIGNGLWFAIATYSKKETATAVVANTSAFTFETRGGTQRIMQSLATVARYPAPSASWTPPNFQGAINVTEDGPDGIDVTVPVFSCNITVARQTVTQSYLSSLFRLTGRVNNANFTIVTDDGAQITFATGECLYLGASGGKRGDEPWEIAHAFAGSPNVTGLSIGDLTGIEKKGWEYLWAYYTARVDDDAKMLVRKPIAAYVEQVYRYDNFGALEL